MSRPVTKEEARDMLLGAFRSYAHYWSTVPELSVRERCDGLAFSILNIFDGCSGAMPCAIDLVLSPNPENKAYSQENGENWIEAGMAINDDCQLHELWHK